MKYLKNFDTTSQYDTYIAGTPDYPNVSTIGNEVKFNDLRNKVGAYIYNDLTLGTATSGKTILGVIVIPAYATNDGKPRWMPINMLDSEAEFDGKSFTDDYMWYDGKYQDIINNIDSIHKINTYPYINNGNTITNEIQGIGNWNWDNSRNRCVYFWTELSAADKANKSSSATIFNSPNNSNLCLIKYNNSFGDNEHILPEPYLADENVNPIYKVYGTLTDDWDHSNQQVVTGIGDSGLFDFANEFYVTTTSGNLGNWYIPTMNEIVLFMAKFNTIKQAIINTGGTVTYNLSNSWYPWSSTFSYVYGGGHPRAWNGSLDDGSSRANWGDDVNNGYHPLFFRHLD